MIYWDTSSVLKLYVSESDSAAWEERALTLNEEFVASALVEVELAYAMIRKEARGDIRRGAADALLAMFRRDVERGRFTLYPVGSDVMHTSIRMAIQCEEAGRPELLRTLDGIHLATAHLLGCKAVAAADRRMRAAGELLGLSLL